MPIHLAIWACIRAILSPALFLRFQARTAERHGVPAASDNDSALVVCRAFWISLLLVVAFAAIGAAAGALLDRIIGHASHKTITGVQIVGTSVLLWGTLFVREWDIQTTKGVTLIERVNRWLYRALYCAGTALLVASLTWTAE